MTTLSSQQLSNGLKINPLEDSPMGSLDERSIKED